MRRVDADPAHRGNPRMPRLRAKAQELAKVRGRYGNAVVDWETATDGMGGTWVSILGVVGPPDGT